MPRLPKNTDQSSNQSCTVASRCPPPLGQCVQEALAAPAFAAAPALARLLSFLADATPGKRLTAYRIALEVFKQPDDFDPQTNSLVRVHVGRLRRLLAEFYATVRSGSPWQLTIPHGRYALQVIPAAKADAAQGPRAGFRPTTLRRNAPSVAVLPVVNLDADPDTQFVCDGLTFELTHRLAQAANLSVIASEAMLRSRGEDRFPRKAASIPVANYTLSCGLGVRDQRLNFTAQLFEASSHCLLWSERYRRDLGVQPLREIQEDIAHHVVGLISSPHGVVERLARQKGPHELALPSYYAVLRFHEYQDLLSPERHLHARDLLEQAVVDTPDYAEAWACLGIAYVGEECFDFNRRDDPPPLERADFAARRALELDPENPTGLHCLALCHASRGEHALFHDVAGRALASAPNRVDILASIGLQTCQTGNWEWGLELLERARAINPLHPSWYWYPSALDAYRRHDYRAALVYAARINTPESFWDPLFTAMICGQLGKTAKATAALRRLLALKPEVAADPAGVIGKVVFNRELTDHCIAGLEKAGLRHSQHLRPGV
jgi:TolB-like protein